jgi:hypothetical protein
VKDGMWKFDDSNPGDYIDFNQKGFVNSESGIISEGETTYKYNDNNLLTVEIYRESGNLVYKDTFVYDEHSQVKSMMRFDIFNNIVFKSCFKYNKQGIKVEMITIKNKEMIKSSSHYDFNGNMVEFRIYNDDGTISYPRIVSKFNNNGDKIEYKVICADSSFRAITSKYDSLHNKISEVWSASGFITKSIRNKYEFDKHQNWIQRLEFINDTLKSVFTRDILYY